MIKISIHAIHWRRHKTILLLKQNRTTTTTHGDGESTTLKSYIFKFQLTTYTNKERIKSLVLHGILYTDIHANLLCWNLQFKLLFLQYIIIILNIYNGEWVNTYVKPQTRRERNSVSSKEFTMPKIVCLLRQSLQR